MKNINPRPHLKQSNSEKLQTTAGNLITVASAAITSQSSDEVTPMTQELRVLSRLCAARGQKIPIFKVQHAPPPSMSFISEVGRRKTTLNREWGYDIRQEFQNGNSVWWIVCDASGQPTIDRTAPAWQTGNRRPMAVAKPRNTASTEQRIASGETHGAGMGANQPNLFHSLADVRQFCSYETGAAK